jgi:hypothetical protein
LAGTDVPQFLEPVISFDVILVTRLKKDVFPFIECVFGGHRRVADLNLAVALLYLDGLEGLLHLEALVSLGVRTVSVLRGGPCLGLSFLPGTVYLFLRTPVGFHRHYFGYSGLSPLSRLAVHRRHVELNCLAVLVGGGQGEVVVQNIIHCC